MVLLPEDFQREKYLKVYLMCDSYIGLDQEYTIDLLKVNQIIRAQAAESQKKKQKKTKDEPTKVTIDAKPPQAMINTTAPDLDQTRDDDTNEAANNMPMQFQLYSDLTSKVFGGDENSKQ